MKVTEKWKSSAVRTATQLYSCIEKDMQRLINPDSKINVGTGFHPCVDVEVHETYLDLYFGYRPANISLITIVYDELHYAREQSVSGRTNLTFYSGSTGGDVSLLF